MSWINLNFQDAMSNTMLHMHMFHEFMMIYIILILSMILYLKIMFLKTKFYSNKIINHQMIEIIWILFPLMILLILALPSIKILYLTEENDHLYTFSIKAIANQWYWTYEYPQFKYLSFDSYMIHDSLINNNFRLLEVNNRLIVPMNMHIRLMTTSNDVIHSFTMPSLGFKMDSIPGRINQVSLMINFPGIFFGQCSEICGMNHSFMPIVMESMSPSAFMLWMKFNTE